MKNRRLIIPILEEKLSLRLFLIKILLIGYLYGIKSERRLEEEVSLNLANRWFCGIDLTESDREMPLIGNYIKSQKAGKSGVNNQICKPLFYS